jgi:D-glycero-alpha-D-manno-heptose 1-phosphate guanylyltransferase
MSEALGRVTAFVLAGGFGTRLRAAVPDRQKVVAPVGGRPVLTRILDQLAGAGVRRAVLGVGFLADQVRDLLGPTYDGMELAYSEDPEPLGTAGALRHARELLDGDPVLVLNGDSYVEANLAAFLAWHRARRATASLLLAGVPDPARYGTVEADPSGRVTAFREKTAGASGGPAAPAWISAGVYLLGRAVIDELPARAPLSFERDVFPALVGAGLSAYRGGGRFIDIGTPESYTEAQDFFAPAPRAEEASRPVTRPFILLDRDGTLIEERHYLSDPGGVVLLPGVVDGLRALRAEGLALVVATNQAGVGRGLFSEDQVAAVHARLSELLAARGVGLDGIFYCPHHPDAGCDCRKPATGLARQAAAALGPGAASVAVVGDKRCDIDLARALGVPGILVTTGYGASELAAAAEPDYAVDSLVEVAAVLRPLGAPLRTASAVAS